MSHNYSENSHSLFGSKSPNSSSKMVNIAIVGGTGYAGFELFRILKKHPHIGTITIFGSKSSATQFAGQYYNIDKIFDLCDSFDTVFLATPAEVSLELTPKLLSLKKNVIDLSGVFRLNTDNIAADYQHWYNLEHTQTHLVKNAQFGLVPWCHHQKLKEPYLVSNPGCYATAVLMALLPLLKNKVIDSSSIVIDAKSGATGAGKKAESALNFSEIDGECLPYKIGTHQHLPEIILAASIYADVKIRPFFSTHLLPVRRGIIASIYVNLAKDKNLKDVDDTFKQYYSDYPLVEFSSEITRELVSLKNVVGTAKTHICYKVDGEKLYLFSTLDNLLKGAASQAVENFNVLQNLPVTMGLEYLESMI